MKIRESLILDFKTKTMKEPLDPTGKDKSLLIDICEDGTKYHWNKKGRIKWTITFFFGILLVYAVRTSMSICATAMARDLGWNKQISGMALSAFFCGYVTTNVLGGYMADRHGGEIIIFYSAICWATLTTLLPLLAHSESIFYSGTFAVLACRFFTGVFQGVFFPSLTSILAKHVAVSERGFVFAFAYSGSSLGTVATGFLGSLIIDLWGWPAVFMLSGMLSLLWAIWLRYLHKISPPIKTIVNQKSIKVKESVPWLKLAFSPTVWALFVAYICNSFTFYNLLSWTPVYFHDAFPQSKGWVFNVVPWLLNFVLTITSGYLANMMLSNGSSITFVRKLYAMIMFISIGVFSLLLNSVETFKQALFVMSLNIGGNAFSSCSIALNSQDLAPKHAGSLHGLMNSAGALAGSIGIYFTGYLLESTGSWSAVFIVISAVSFIGAFAYGLFGSGERVV